MKKSKFLILLITLSFPVILYLFLRSYGQNEFDLPVFFENEQKLFCHDSLGSVDDIQLVDLKDSSIVEFSMLYEADYKIIHFPNIQDKEIQTLKNELNRVHNTFGDLSLNILSFISSYAEESDDFADELFLSRSRTKTIVFLEDDKDYLINCIYAFPTSEWESKHPSEETISIDKTLVLIDDKNRIRGYYNGYETKEVDRLILEIRVLLSKK
jgi:hypothetical protein